MMYGKKGPDHQTMVGPTPSTITTTSHQQQQSPINHTTNQQHTTNQKSGAIDTIPPSMFVLSNKIYANKSSKKQPITWFPRPDYTGHHQTFAGIYPYNKGTSTPTTKKSTINAKTGSN